MAFLHELVVDCLQFERAFCTAACPFCLDIRDFVGKLQQGRFNIAYKTYQQTVGFPGIVSTLCPEPCRLVCPMKDAGGAISLRLLERASMDFARTRIPDQFNMPWKPRRIAVVGGGISGLACALRLATRKYRVTVFERSDRIGGHLNGLIDPDLLREEIDRPFTHETYELKLNTDILSLDSLDWDAVYVATGSDGPDFGLALNPDGAFATNCPGIFMGGSRIGHDTVRAIADGLNAANAIERYLKIGSMNQPDEPQGTRLIPEAIRIIPGEAIQPGNGGTFSKDEAILEAKRCLRCTCDKCNFHSPLMSYFSKFPKRITEEVEVTLKPSSLDGHATLATRLMSTCMHCGLCKQVCPVDIDTGEFLLASHRAMRETGKMPWAFHEFFLRDMAFSNHDAALIQPPPKHTPCDRLFFPGCQLGASDPDLVIESYRFLLKYHPGTALMLQCCGAPADWGGDDPMHRAAIGSIRTAWEGLGRPTLIFACPMCRQMFAKYLPEIPDEFLYGLFEAEGITPGIRGGGGTVSVYDPCASRHEPHVQETIRNLARKAGFRLEPLFMERTMAECCSYGGHVAIAHPPYAEHAIRKRIGQNDHPYITYCSNCRDIFEKSGKRTYHILDVMFGRDVSGRVQPTVSERQTNRMHLKHRLLRDFWDVETMNAFETPLFLSDELKRKLDRDRILESDLKTVIDDCETTGRKLFDPVLNTFTGHKRIGNMTYWVEYRLKPGGAIEIVNGYCHRMRIEEPGHE